MPLWTRLSTSLSRLVAPVFCEKEVGWAAKTRKTNIASGTKCAECSRALAISYPMRSWEDIFQEMAVSTEFAACVQKVLREARGRTLPVNSFEQHNYSAMELTGFRVEKPLLFYTNEVFESCFGMSPDRLGVESETFVDFNGAPIEGVMLDGQGGKMQPMSVYAFYESKGRFEKELQKSGQQLRADQVTEFKKEYEKANRKVLPAALHKHASLRVADVPDMVADKRRKEEEEQMRKELIPAAVEQEAAAEAAEEDIQKYRERERVIGAEFFFTRHHPPKLENLFQTFRKDAGNAESSEDDVVEEDVGAAVAFPDAKPKGKGKSKKGKGRGRGKRVAAGPASGEAPSCTRRRLFADASTGAAAGSASAAGAQDNNARSRSPAARTAVTTRSTVAGFSSRARVSPRDKIFGKAREWQRSLTPASVLEEGNLGRKVWQADQSCLALERTHHDHMNTIQLREHSLNKRLGPLGREFGQHSSKCRKLSVVIAAYTDCDVDSWSTEEKS
eukprot:6492428-Amphidinium_carterae.1